MPTDRIVWVNPSATGGAQDGSSEANGYLSQTAAIAGEISDPDLVANDERLVVLCSSTLGDADLAGIPSITESWNTDETTGHYILFVAHTGNFAGTEWDSAIYRMTIGAIVPGQLNRDVKWEGIQIDAVHSGSQGFFNISSGGSAYRAFERCYFRYSGTGGSTNYVFNFQASLGIFVSNCLFEGWPQQAVWNTRTGGTQSFYYDNIFIDCITDISYTTADLAVVKGNLSTGSTNGFSGTYAAGTDYNATDQPSLGYTVTGGGNSNDRTSQTFTFASATDYAITTGDTGAYQFGVDLTSDANYPVSTDIQGLTRQTTTSMGAFDPDAANLLTIDTEPASVKRGETGVILGVSGGGLGGTTGTATYGGQTCTITAWSDTSVTLTIPSSIDLQHDTTGYAFQLVSDGATAIANSSVIPFNEPDGYDYTDLVGPDTSSTESILFGYTGDAPVTGDQVVYENTSSPDAIPVSVDVTGIVTFDTKPTQTQTISRYVIKIDGTLGTEADFTYSIGGAVGGGSLTAALTGSITGSITGPIA